MKRIFFVIVAGVLASAPASAASLPISVLSNCAQPTARTSLDDQIRACTLIIETPGSDAEYMLAAHLARALAYEEKGDFDKAIVDYTAALALQPNDDFYLARAECYQKKGDFERALADINALIQAKPNYAPAYSTRGKVYAAKKDFPRALADCTRATELAPQDASTWTLRARLYGQMGDEDRALSDLSRAIALEPDNTDLRHYRGLKIGRAHV